VRILIATQHLGVVGGVETYLRALVPRLAARGHQVGVLAETPAAGPDGEILAGGADVPTWLASGHPTDRLADWRPDVVYAHGLADPGLEAALADRYPTALFAHNYHGTCVSGTKCHARPGYQTCRRALGPGCLGAYFPRRCGGRNPLTMLRLYDTQRRRRVNLARYHAVLVASRHMAEEYRRHGIPDDRLAIVPLFPADVDPDSDPPAPRNPTDRVLFVGRITRLKGLDHLVAALPAAAAALGRRLTLVVAGDGPDRPAAEAACAQAGVPAEFLGWVGAARRTAEMRAADILAVPSVWPEPFGLVGIEAGCVGLPAVGYALGGIPDWLTPGRSGEAAPGDRPDPRELAAALVRAITDPDYWQRLRHGAWDVARGFTPDAHLERLDAILRRIGTSARKGGLMMKSLARRLLPRPVWRQLRAWRMRRILATFRPYLAEHEYAGVRLKVHIADPLARGWYDQPWGPLVEVDLLRAAALVPEARVFDVGAHQGVVAMVLAHHVGPTGEVIAVEALPHNARQCEINRDLNGLRQIRVEAVAVSDRPGELAIVFDLNSQFSHEASTTSSLRVRAVTIDELADKYGPPDVLFIDVEGYECHALHGAVRTMARTPDSYVEIHRGHGLESAGGSVADVFAFFPPAQYDLRVWSDEDPTPREVHGPEECPPGGRVFLVALRRDR
jgi:FkbM family methyltransferase